MSPLRFPQRLITITFTPGDDTEPQLTHPVTLKGIESDTEKLNIVLTVGKKTFYFIHYLYNFANSKQMIMIILPQILLKQPWLHMVN